MGAEAKKKRRTRDPRTLTTGFGSTNFEYLELTTHDWNQIQRKFGKNTKISDAARAQLNGVTVHYSIHHQLARRVKSLKAVIERIRRWQTQTNILRNFVWTREGQPNVSKETSGSLENLLKQYFLPDAKGHQQLYPLAHLANFLDGARAIGEYFIGKIRAVENDDKNVESWLVWAALVISICHRNNFPVMIFHGSRRKFHPGFIELLDRLQSILHPAEPKRAPPEQSHETIGRKRKHEKVVERRAITARKLKTSSLRKLALQAYNIAEGSSVEELFVLLAYWGIGQTRISKDMIFGIEAADLEVIQTGLRGQKRSHRAEKNVAQS
jgi:hypothetical protein